MKPIIILFLATICFSQEQIKKWEALGLTSSSELTIAIDSGLSEKEIMEIVSVGVSIRTHLSKPWKGLEITEKEWYGYVRSGLDSTGIYDAVYKKNHKKTFGQHWNDLVAGMKEGVK
jgi:hypothetical protein